MGKKVRDRWKAAAITDRHHARMSLVLPDPCAALRAWSFTCNESLATHVM